MRLLVVGAGGVGGAIAVATAESDAFASVTVCDVDGAHAERAIAGLDPARFTARALDASDADQLSALLAAEQIDLVMNACDPRLNPPIFTAAFAAGCHYVDMAMTLSSPEHMLGADQLAASDAWESRGQLALVGMGVEPGLSDVFARYAADHLFTSIDDIDVRDGSDLTIDGYDFAPTFSVWTTIEECLNPPLVWERARGWYTLLPFAEPETFVFPDGIGPIECVHVEHEEVILIHAGSTADG